MPKPGLYFLQSNIPFAHSKIATSNAISSWRFCTHISKHPTYLQENFCNSTHSGTLCKLAKTGIIHHSHYNSLAHSKMSSLIAISLMKFCTHITTHPTYLLLIFGYSNLSGTLCKVSKTGVIHHSHYITLAHSKMLASNAISSMKFVTHITTYPTYLH